MERQIRMDITPEIAKDWLDNHNHNNYRKYKPNYAKYLGKKMKAGYWQRNEQPIVFDTNNELKDGQNRLGGIVESGVTLKDWPVSYVSPDVTIFDMNRARTWAEYTNAEMGRPLSTTLSGAISIIINGVSQGLPVSMEEKVDYYCANEELLDTCNLLVQRGTKPYVLKKAGCLAAIYCGLKLGILTRQDMEDFCRIVNTGLPIDGKTCEAPLVLRRSLQNHSFSGGYDTYVYTLDATAQSIVNYKRQLKATRSYVVNGSGLKLIKKVQELEQKEDET